MAIRESKGDYLVCLSAHCPVVNTDWLEIMKSNLSDPRCWCLWSTSTNTLLAKNQIDVI